MKQSKTYKNTMQLKSANTILKTIKVQNNTDNIKN